MSVKHNKIDIADFDLPKPINDDFDNIVIDYLEDIHELRISLFYQGHWRSEVSLNLDEKAIYDGFSEVK